MGAGEEGCVSEEDEDYVANSDDREIINPPKNDLISFFCYCPLLQSFDLFFHQV
jgi:hypothetical protein